MDQDIEKRIANLEQQVQLFSALLTKEIAKTNKRIADCEEGTVGYMDQHRREHHEIADKLWPMYYKVFPEYGDTMLRLKEIVGETTLDGSDPQP